MAVVTQGVNRSVEQFAPGIPVYCNSYRFAAGGAAQAFVVPSGANLAIFSPLPRSADFGISAGTAAIPGGSVTDGTATFPNPTILSVTPGATYSLIGNATVQVDIGVAFYAAGL